MILLFVQESFIIYGRTFTSSFGLGLHGGKKCVESRSMNKGGQGHLTTRGAQGGGDFTFYNVKSPLCPCVPRVGYSGA